MLSFYAIILVCIMILIIINHFNKTELILLLGTFIIVNILLIISIQKQKKNKIKGGISELTEFRINRIIDLIIWGYLKIHSFLIGAISPTFFIMVFIPFIISHILAISFPEPILRMINYITKLFESIGDSFVDMYYSFRPNMELMIRLKGELKELNIRQEKLNTNIIEIQTKKNKIETRLEDLYKKEDELIKIEEDKLEIERKQLNDINILRNKEKKLEERRKELNKIRTDNDIKVYEEKQYEQEQYKKEISIINDNIAKQVITNDIKSGNLEYNTTEVVLFTNKIKKNALLKLEKYMTISNKNIYNKEFDAITYDYYNNKIINNNDIINDYKKNKEMINKCIKLNDNKYTTLFLLLIESNHNDSLEILKELLKLGANPDKRIVLDDTNKIILDTPLLLSIKMGRIAIIKELIKHPLLDLNALNIENGNNAFMEVIYTDLTNKEKKALLYLLYPLYKIPLLSYKNDEKTTVEELLDGNKNIFEDDDEYKEFINLLKRKDAVHLAEYNKIFIQIKDNSPYIFQNLISYIFKVILDDINNANSNKKANNNETSIFTNIYNYFSFF